MRCNLYKSDFWVEPPNEPTSWNPRLDIVADHFWLAEDGHLFSLTEKGELSIRILNLNRLQLVSYRHQQRLLLEERRMLEESEISLEVLYRLGEEQREIIRQQQILLEEQRQLLKILLGKF